MRFDGTSKAHFREQNKLPAGNRGYSLLILVFCFADVLFLGTRVKKMAHS